MTGRKMLMAGVVAVVALVAVVAVAVMASGSDNVTTGRCVDGVGDTYEFHDNGMFLPGSTLADMQLKDEEDYVSWTVPTAPLEGSDIVSVELVRDDEWLTVTVELADRWVPYPHPEDTTWAPGDPLSGSDVTVLLRSETLSGVVLIQDSAAETTFRVGRVDTPAQDRSEVAIEAPAFDGSSATVRIPAAEIDQLGDSFDFAAWSSLIIDADLGILDNCPDMEGIGDVEGFGDPETPTVPFPNDVAPGDPAQPSEAAPSSTSSSTTTTTSTPETRQPTSTAPATPSAECPRTWTEPIHELELVAQCLYAAHREGDREWAAVFADPEAVDKLFEFPWEPPEWQFDRCEENAAVPPYGYCYYWIDGEPHGVQVEMVMDGGVSAGISVLAIEHYG